MPVPHKGIQRRLAGLGLILLGLGLLGLAAWRGFSPLVRDLAAAEARNRVTAAVNEIVADMLREGGFGYDRLVRLERDESGAVTAVHADMAEVNRVRAELVTALADRLASGERLELGLPLGSVLGASLFSGLGPELPLRILSVNRMEADLTSRFTASGINQTLHQIRAEVRVEVRVLTPGGTVTGRVDTRVPVAETLIVGRVPESYTYFEGSDSWDEPLEQFDITT